MGARHKISFMTADQDFTTTTLEEATDLTTDFESSETGFYVIQGCFFLSSVTGFGWAINDSSTSTYCIYSGNGGGGGRMSTGSFGDDGSNFPTPNNPDIHAYAFRGFINVTSNPTWSIEFGQHSSNATPVTLHEGSYVHFMELIDE